MPLQNRVDPFGNIVAHPARGMLMGNRGCLHDGAGRIVRTTARAAWITCLPIWPGVRRELMAIAQYTELFFLDEATALAAGHRPCGSCRPEALAVFKRAWAIAHGLSYMPPVTEIDGVLRSDRYVTAGDMDDPPSGAIVAVNGIPVLRWDSRWLAWSFDGYAPIRGAPAVERCLTTGPVIAVLRAGYAPVVHGSATIG